MKCCQQGLQANTIIRVVGQSSYVRPDHVVGPMWSMLSASAVGASMLRLRYVRVAPQRPRMTAAVSGTAINGRPRTGPTSWRSQKP